MLRSQTFLLCLMIVLVLVFLLLIQVASSSNSGVVVENAALDGDGPSSSSLLSSSNDDCAAAERQVCDATSSTTTSNEDDVTIPQPPLVLIIGANGYIGSSLVEEFLKQGYRVRGTVRNATDPKKIQPLYGIQKHIKKTTETAATTTRNEPLLHLMSLNLDDPVEQYSMVMKDVTWVYHTAALVSLTKLDPIEEQRQIDISVYSIRAVLQQAATSTAATTISKVIYTGSVAAVAGGYDTKTTNIKNFTELDWTIINQANTNYHKVKTLTERAGWDFMEDYHETLKRSGKEPTFSFTTILPSVVLGPVPHTQVGSSIEFIRRLLSGDDPVMINLYTAYVDIRDVTKAHILATTNPNAANKRFIVCHPNGQVFMPTFATILKEEFESMGYTHIPTYVLPHWMVWSLSLIDTNVASIYSLVGKHIWYDVSASMEILQLNYTNPNQTIIDAGHSLIQYGIVHRTKNYRPPPALHP